MTTAYRIVIAGSLPAAVSGALRSRFDGVRVYPVTVHTVIECSVADQSALRSLMTQLWDVGGTVLLLADLTKSEGTLKP